jgi:DegV family protein with EDD domain
MVKVVADSCASIPDTLVKQLDIEIVPYYIHRGVETLRDLVDVKSKELFDWISKADRMPQTANPSPGDYLDAFRKAAVKAREIVSVHMTSKGSGAYQSAMAAKQLAQEIFPEIKIEVVDTLQVAMVHGWATVEAARGALQGLSIEEVADTARSVASRGTMIQTADTLRYLYLGGRIGKAQHLAGSLLSIKPLISMEDGVIVALGQARSRAKAYLRMVDLMHQRVAGGARIKAAFTHVTAEEEAERLRELVCANFDCAETLLAELSPALGVHTGPGTVGICYYIT